MEADGRGVLTIECHGDGGQSRLTPGSRVVDTWQARPSLHPSLTTPCSASPPSLPPLLSSCPSPSLPSLPPCCCLLPPLDRLLCSISLHIFLYHAISFLLSCLAVRLSPCQLLLRILSLFPSRIFIHSYIPSVVIYLTDR